MEILKLGNNNEDFRASKSPRAKKIKVAKAAVGIGTIASLAGLGSTLAANISLNGDANVEFGQGVAQTAACDADGFTITPVSYYDSDSSTFRLDYVEVSGLNLIPAGADVSTASSNGNAWVTSYSSYGDASAVAAHPGQYFDASALSSIDPDGDSWVNTCDEVVLDFKAYTDDVLYSSNTVDGFGELSSSSGNTIPNTTSSPLYWSVDGNGGSAVWNDDVYNSSVAFIFDSTNEGDTYDDNIGTRATNNNINLVDFSSPSDLNGTGFTASSTFRFTTNGDYAPAAGAISKITVESMKYFPSDYYSIGSLGDQIL